MASVSEESKPSSSSASPDISVEEIQALFAKGKRHYIKQETILAYKCFEDVCAKMSAKYGQTANECGEAYLYYGKSLLELARLENGVLGNALKAGPDVEEDDNEDLPNQEGPSLKDIPDEERNKVRQDVKAALTVAPVEPDLTLPPNEISKEKAKEEGVNEAMEEGANEAKEGGDDVGDEEEQKDEGEKEEEDGADAEAQQSENADAGEDDGGEDADADEDADEHGSEADEKEEMEEGNENPEDVPDMQLAWEMLELSRLIFKRQEGKELKLKQAEANHALGEISMELEHYAEAVGDFSECLRLQDPILDADDRLRAETHYNLGLSYLFDKHYEKAIEHFKKAINTIELRLDNTEKKIVAEEKEKGKENVDPGSPLISWRKEVEELKGLLPDMAAKIEDAEEMKRSADAETKMVSAIAKEFMKTTSSSFDAPTITGEPKSNGFDAPTTSGAGQLQEQKVEASDISHLVKKKVEATDISHLVKKKTKPANAEIDCNNHSSSTRKMEDDADEVESKKARQADESAEESKKEPKEVADEKPATEVMETA